jgi:hypothetical protein
MKEKSNPLLGFWAKPQAARMEQKMDQLLESVQQVEKKNYFMDRRQTGRQTQERRIEKKTARDKRHNAERNNKHEWQRDRQPKTRDKD